MKNCSNCKKSSMNNELKPICPKKVDCENNSFNHGVRVRNGEDI